MLKSIILAIIGIPACMFIFIGVRFLIVILIGKLVYLTGPVTALTILTIILFIFFAFFFAGFLLWFHEKTSKQFFARTSGKTVIQFLTVLAGGIFIASIVGAFGEMMFLAEHIDQNLFYLLFVIFTALLFFSIFRYGRIKKRLSRNQMNWWRG